MDPDVRPVLGSDRHRAIGTLTLAFTADPFIRWLFGDPGQYLAHFPSVVQAFGGAAFEHGGAWQWGDFAAVAMWLPPGVEADGEATVELFRAAIDPPRFDQLLEVFGQLEAAHPTTAHWYLPWFGVDSAQQGRGLGSRLMAPCLEIVDRQHLPAFLDSTNPRNVSFYQRHGFRVVAEHQTGSSPPMISMLRESR